MVTFHVSEKSDKPDESLDLAWERPNLELVRCDAVDLGTCFEHGQFCYCVDVTGFSLCV